MDTCPVGGSFEVLPDELVVHILQFMPGYSLCGWGRQYGVKVNRQLAASCSDANL